MWVVQLPYLPDMTATGLSLVTRAPVISNNGGLTGAAVVIPERIYLECTNIRTQ